ncbi:uncharacterized protein LOC109794199 [Cajanus cajan]|uniref:uncharacterized protein LOC109794199 n=1 Tax=Cajanus cajan TaxID=3821 RepID=UPI00098DD383|nr:uncharacterized protein LOC109794199 [Cajanus cajan]
MIAWSVELSEFGIQYESRGPLKAQCLADFVADLTPSTPVEPQGYLKEGTLHEDKDEARKVRMRSAKFIVIGDELFKRGISTPLLKRLTTSQEAYIIKEIHQGICGMHSWAHSMATKVLRAGYYWPTLKFGIPHTLVTDNGQQFIAQGFKDFLRELGIKHLPTSVEHPQTNGQAEAASKVILWELKKRLGSPKGQWPDELPSILWAYHCAPQRQVFNNKQNARELAADLDLVDEL